MVITVQEILIQVTKQLQATSQTAQLDAQVLLAHHLGKPRAWILAHPEAPVAESKWEQVKTSADRLEHGEPLPYVTGHWEFFGLDFRVTPSVLIPRPETELLVEKAIQWLQAHPQRRTALDLGTGTGCIGIALAKHTANLRITLTDISGEALEVARWNAEKQGVLAQVEFRQANLLDGIGGTFELMCANLPYIPSKTVDGLPVARHEPREALDGGSDGMDYIRRLLLQARGQLTAGGLLLIEIEASQGGKASKLARKDYPLSNIQILQDLAGRDRCLMIERPELIAHLCATEEWVQSQGRGEFTDSSLRQNGFIHCSQPEQILEVASRFYNGAAELVILWIEPGKLKAETRWELADKAYFPHVYGPINLEAVRAVSELRRDASGSYAAIKIPDWQNRAGNIPGGGKAD